MTGEKNAACMTVRFRMEGGLPGEHAAIRSLPVTDWKDTGCNYRLEMQKSLTNKHGSRKDRNEE
jgi:hypothetical protein